MNTILYALAWHLLISARIWEFTGTDEINATKQQMVRKDIQIESKDKKGSPEGRTKLRVIKLRF